MNDQEEVLPRGEAAFAVMMAAFVVVLVLTNIIGVKLFLAFPESLPRGLFGEAITLTTGLITYPITFLLTDIVCEVFGRRRANLMVATGFVMSLLTLVLIQISLALPGSPAWPSGSPDYATVAEMQRAFESVFTLPGILIFGSMTAYLVAQLMDVRLFHFWKQVTRGRHLWLRNNASTMTSQLVDTVIVNSIFLGFGLGLDWLLVAKIIVASYLFKLLIAALDTPFIYLGAWWVRRYVTAKADPSAAPAQG
ncbi:MAG: queuosine precursor transporter [Alphaproteobacteria bacterium]|nr:queuosine precursor transporter [Alphaproteobacteria bacterium]